jgi:hypothetical protein
VILLENQTQTKPLIYLSTIFWWCNDVGAMREFYTDLIGLPETYFQDDDNVGWLTYQSGQLQIVFIRASSTLPIHSAWSKQPGYRGGPLEATSWVISVPYTEFISITERLKQANVPLFQDEPIVPQPDHQQGMSARPRT